jgi:WD40 repeat protein
VAPPTTDVGTVKQWDARTGKEKATLRTQKDVPQKLAASPDGKLLAWDDRTGILLWDADRGTVRTTLTGLVGGLRGLAFSRDGTKLAAAESFGTVAVWDVARPAAPPTTFKTKDPTCLAWNHDGTVLAVGGTKTITLWDLAAKRSRKEIAGLPDNVNGLAYSPDGKVLAAGSLEWLLCYDPDSGHELAKTASPFTERHHPGCLAFSPDGKTLASGSAEVISGSIILWDVGALLKPRP